MNNDALLAVIGTDEDRKRLLHGPLEIRLLVAEYGGKEIQYASLPHALCDMLCGRGSELLRLLIKIGDRKLSNAASCEYEILDNEQKMKNGKNYVISTYMKPELHNRNKATPVRGVGILGRRRNRRKRRRSIE